MERSLLSRGVASIGKSTGRRWLSSCCLTLRKSYCETGVCDILTAFKFNIVNSIEQTQTDIRQQYQMFIPTNIYLFVLVDVYCYECVFILIGFLLIYMMNLKIAAIFLLSLCASAAVTVNTITGITDNNLVYSGTIPISATNNLFFTYYGVDGQKDQASLKNYPLLILVGKYITYNLVPAPLRSIMEWGVLVQLDSTMI
jgi:hypothetical protein